MLRWEGWKVNPKRVERLWRQEGLKVPSRQPKRRRLWLHDGSCVRLKPTHRNHVWSYDFMHERTQEGRAFRLLTILDEYSRECLSIDVQRRMKSDINNNDWMLGFIHHSNFHRWFSNSEFTRNRSSLNHGLYTYGPTHNTPPYLG